ncbi:sigma-70 family RNA polymerase sigma factor [candidate division KSB1 bacterium]|nr:sigma-70 family RNA polymerase sigma factor [candidate division KSB1 bacterium]
MPEFETTYRDLFPVIFKFLYRMLGQAQLAEDITQESFVILYHQLGEIGNPRAWLYRVASNKAKNIIKRNKTWHQIVSKNNEATVSRDMENDILENEKIRLLRKSIQSMTARDQTLLQLYMDGLSYREMAEVTGLRESSIGKFLSRAIEKCSKKLKKEFS